MRPIKKSLVYFSMEFLLSLIACAASLLISSLIFGADHLTRTAFFVGLAYLAYRATRPMMAIVKRRIVGRAAIGVAVLAVIVAASSDADACSRCRRYGRSCVYYRAPYVAPVVAVAQTPVYVVQNNYPAPMVGQGRDYFVSNGGGLQAALLPSFDMQQYASQKMQLRLAYQATDALEAQRLDSIVTRIAEIQAPIQARLAVGISAEKVLRAAGLDPNVAVQGSSSSVLIQNDGYGHLSVTPADPRQVQAYMQSQQNQVQQPYQNGQQYQYQPGGPGQPLQGAQPLEQPNQGPQPQQQNGSFTTKFCAECHGLAVAKPGGGLYLDLNDENVLADMRKKYFLIKAHLADGSMPKANAAIQATQQDREAVDAEIFNRLLSSPAGKGF